MMSCIIHNYLIYRTLMKLIEQLQLLDRLDSLIRRKGTGNYQALASRLGVSPRNIYYLLDTLKDLGAEIEYCKIRKSYYYLNEVELNFDALLKPENIKTDK